MGEKLEYLKTKPSETEVGLWEYQIWIFGIQLFQWAFRTQNGIPLKNHGSPLS